MSHELFDQTLIPRSSQRGRRATVGVSLALHAAGLTTLVALQFAGGATAPSIVQPLVAFVAPKELPKIPVVAALAPSPALSPVAPLSDAAPTTPPDRLPLSEPAAPSASGLNITTGNAGATPFGPAGMGDTVLKAPPPPAAIAAPPAIVRVGGQIAAPARVHYQAPTYPRLAQTARVDGTVILEATIDEGGVVRDVRVIRSIPLLDRAAIDAVSTWRYTPTRLNGVPVPVVMTVSVSFTLRP